MARIKNWLDCWRARRRRAERCARMKRMVAACDKWTQAYFDTFDEALADVGWLDRWPDHTPKWIQCGGNLRVTVGKTTISCYREPDGRYERPLVY